MLNFTSASPFELTGISTGVKWKIDRMHSEIGFTATHSLVAKVKGFFKNFGGRLYTTNNQLITSDVNFWINACSIETYNEKRNSYLKGSDFLDTENYSDIVFRGISLRKNVTTGKYLIVGDLTIKRVSHSIKLNIEFNGKMKDPQGNQRIGFYIDGKLNRKDWELLWNNNFLDSGGILVSDEIRIYGKLQLIEDNI